MQSELQAAQENAIYVGSRSLVKEKAAARTLEKRPRVGEATIRFILLFCGLVSILTTLGILYTLGENSLLFFGQEAWAQTSYDTIVQAQITNLSQAVALPEELNDVTTRVPLNLDLRATLPFANGQLIQIGDEEMLVTNPGNRELIVQRGYNNTPITAHAAGTAILMHVNQTVKLADDVDRETTEIAVSPGSASVFKPDDRIKIDQEVMRIQAVDTVNSILTVERAFAGTQPGLHQVNLPINSPKAVTLTEFFTSTEWNPQLGKLGILPLLNATLTTTFFALIVSLPMGLGVAIYLSEFASLRARALIKPVLEMLVGVPTVVYGYFALTFVTPLLQSVFGVQVKQFNTLSAGLVMSLLILPTIASISEDALSAVPRSLREASYGLGATKLETIRRIVLPAAVSGIMAAFLLGISRAVGETMIVALAAGAGPNFTFNPFEGAETMTGHIVRIAGGDISYNTIDYNSLFAIGLLLFFLTLLFNIVSGAVSRRFREAY